VSEQKATPDAATAAPPKGPVIRKLEAARETAQERLLRKHLPAWVISGAVNVGVVALAMVLMPNEATPKQTEKVVTTSLDKDEQDTPDKDLTNEDPGLQSNLEAALPELERIDQATVDAVETKDNIGQPNAPELDTVALPALGLNPSEFTAPGAPGEVGDVKMGGGFMGNTTASFPGRSGATKSKLLKEGGGNEASEQAVARGLAWLARQQKPDGSWVFDGGDKDEVIAATGMALLPFLAAGETHKTGKTYAKTVRSGLSSSRAGAPSAGSSPAGSPGPRPCMPRASAPSRCARPTA
jgi:hypothetical protein